MGAPEAGEIRRRRWEGVSRKSGRAAEGDCPTHSGTGSLLSSQAGSPTSKAPSRPHVSWGAQKGGRGEYMRGKREGPSGGVGEEQRVTVTPRTQARGAY